ncbi:MAG: hypothetical protein PWQ73_319 [Petrotoga sp.]|nr:hypothetical protein [Petrotoga sp.]
MIISVQIIKILLSLWVGSVCRNVQTMFLNDFDLDLGFLRGTPLTFGKGALKQTLELL